jgi:uncharacterized membrane protein YjjP (DUF1212 family)
MTHPPEPGTGEAAGVVGALDTVMKAAVLLQESGQSTSMTLTAVDRLNAGLGIRSSLIPSWTSLMLTSGRADVPVRVASVSPVGINMRRVATAMRIIDRAEDGPLDRDVVDRQLDAARALKPSNDVVFTIACATGAGALAVVFGVTDPGAVLWVAVSAAVGGLIRDADDFDRYTSQALVAPLRPDGAAAMHLDLCGGGIGGVCPEWCRPGPAHPQRHLDLLALRITPGIARLAMPR